MLKKTITFTDYDGVERTEDFYFNLNQAEITEMQLSKEGGLREWLERMVKSENKVEIMKMFKMIMLKAYGEKSLDGRRFIKSDQISQEFTQTEAYNQLFMELVTNQDTMSEFINGIVPKDWKEKVSE